MRANVRVSNGVTRYYFPWASPLRSLPVWTGIPLGAALLLVFIDQSLISLSTAIVLLAFAAVSYAIWPTQELFAELGEKELTIQLLTKTKIRYEDILTVEPRRYEMSAVPRTVVNLILKSGNWGGSNWPLEGPKGEIDPGGALIRFRRRIWFSVPLPPFRVPRRVFDLRIEDGQAFIDDLSARLQHQ